MPQPAMRSNWTVAEFLAWEVGQEARFEFDGDAPVAMVGARAAHHRIVRNVETALRARLRRCEVFRETMKLRMARTVRYPDVMVVCVPVSDAAVEVTDPVVVFEVLSDGDAGKDRITKNEEYRQTVAIQRYVILEQDRVAATVFARVGDDWVGRVLVGGQAQLTMPEIEVEVALGDFYVGVEMSEDDR